MTDVEEGLRDLLSTVELAATVPPDLVRRLHRRDSRYRALIAGSSALAVVSLVLGSGIAVGQDAERHRPAPAGSAAPRTSAAGTPTSSTELVATVHGQHGVTVRLLRSDGTTERQLTLPVDAMDVSVSPDGRWLTYEDRDGLQVTAATRIAPRLLIRGDTAAPFGWSPDSRQIVYRSTDQSISVVQIGSGTHHVVAQRLGFAYDADWSPDGNRIVVSTLALTGQDGHEQENPGKPGSLLLFTPSGTRLRTISTSCAAPAHPRWSPDGRSLAWYCGWLSRKETDPWPAHPVQVLSLDTGKRTDLGTAESQQPSWLSNGVLILVPVPLPVLPTGPATTPPMTRPTSAQEVNLAGRQLGTLHLPPYDDLQVRTSASPG